LDRQYAMVLNKTILILEDDLLTLSKLLERLSVLEQDQPYSLSTVILTNHKQVRELINNNSNLRFDIVLLDRDCKLNGSFHEYNIEQFGADNIISISSVPEYNQEAQNRGVKRVILKDLKNRDEFADKVVTEIEKILNHSSLIASMRDFAHG